MSADGRPHVVDFGLVALARSAPTAGTLAYMSPEQLGGNPASQASDWYSFGVLAYEALTGVLPAASRDVAELVLRKSNRRFRRARQLDPGISPELDELLWSLLDPNPARRAGPIAVRAVLSTSGSGSTAPNRKALTLFGRDEEIRRLGSLFDVALSTGRRVVVLEGESGVGKTSVVRTFLDERAAKEAIVLESAARPQELVAWRAVDGLADGLVTAIRTAADDVRDQLSTPWVCATVRIVAGCTRPSDAGSRSSLGPRPCRG